MNYIGRICCVFGAVFLVFSICIPVSAAGGVSIGVGPGAGSGYEGESVGPENASMDRDMLQDPDGDMLEDRDRVTVRDQDRVRESECNTDEACNATRLRAMISERNQVYQADAGGISPLGNGTERAVYAFRAAAPLTGGSASDLIRLSEEINGSVRTTVKNEEKIRSQNAFMVFLFGGDQTSADAIMQHVVQNRVRTEEINRLIDGCECDEETASLLREQVQVMEQEQARFEEVAATEKDKKGIFGFFG
ncbi:hypothetical protein L0665_03335 [Methanogenium marinum]|uniref:Uncharacterized protein n=1 Tax=Methanogenium marinum TaxID=348610 RepID=A0A9Q4PVK0_9EURY|nr:hypothetical protein [Methanogenium marinum]MDE4907644.1 hypothetical protein [Methanogenium marinum]